MNAVDISQFISEKHRLSDLQFRLDCRRKLNADGVVVLDEFLNSAALQSVRQEATDGLSSAYFCQSSHNVYLTPPVAEYAMDHPRNRNVVSSKGLIADDQINASSVLKQIYASETFTDFIAETVGLEAIYPYADDLSCVNIHYARTGQELGWHFDNSSFATTLLIEKPDGGSRFEYVRDVRDADAGEMNFDAVGSVLDGTTEPQMLDIEPGTLVLFRGRNSMHRVTPTEGEKTRMLAVLAYNSQPGVSLSQSARETFYGRLD